MSKNFDMVICSTLNQLVNYIPIVLLNETVDNVYTITFQEGSKKDKLYNQFNNEIWDKNLNNALENTKNIDLINCNTGKDVKAIFTKIKEKVGASSKNIVWNITGGQRNTVLAMLKVIQKRVNEEKNDKIIYFEGNNDNLKLINAKDYIGNSENLEEKNLFDQEDGKLNNKNNLTKEELDLNKALLLAGFQFNNIDLKKEKELDEIDPFIKTFYRKLNKRFEEEIENNYKSCEVKKKDNLEDEECKFEGKDLVKLLFGLNKKANESNDKYKRLGVYIKKNYFKPEQENISYNILKKKMLKDDKKIKQLQEVDYEYIKFKYEDTEYEIRNFRNGKKIDSIINDIRSWSYQKQIIEDIIGEVYKEENINKDEEEKIINELFNCGGYNQNKFGFIFENMILTLILDVVKELKNKGNEYYIDVKHSVKIYDDKKDKENIKKEENCFTEFDIMLLTKYGKVIVIECKSGTMDHTVAKSREFATYAASGVYGLPILSIPALKDDNIDPKNYCKAVKVAEKSARRSQMSIWYMDQIVDNIKAIAGEEND
ncbi:hypothetical protein [Clostridium oceanicum]|uniref:CRISPR-associated protein n=1 Tax=Clostridium oceanicum TaxID=1543 RepID=A0ABP3US25_9CLOT